MSCFWGETIISKEEEIPLSKKHLVPSALLVLLTVGIGFGVEGLAPYVNEAAKTLMDPTIYVEAVLVK